MAKYRVGDKLKLDTNSFIVTIVGVDPLVGYDVKFEDGSTDTYDIHHVETRWSEVDIKSRVKSKFKIGDKVRLTEPPPYVSGTAVPIGSTGVITSKYEFDETEGDWNVIIDEGSEYAYFVKESGIELVTDEEGEIDFLFDAEIVMDALIFTAQFNADDEVAHAALSEYRRALDWAREED
jgi:hypothetical protein